MSDVATQIPFELRITDRRESEPLGMQWATRWLSFMDKETDLPPVLPAHQTVLRFDDVHRREDPDFRHGPKLKDVKAIRSFSATIRPGDRVLVNCRAGIGRSTAAALIIFADHGLPGAVSLAHVVRIRPELWPNPIMLELADRLLKLDGEGSLAAVVANWKAETTGLRDLHI
jgi:predicted protein tyrosine phosphatase